MKEKRISYRNSVTDFLIEPQFRIYRHILLVLLLAIIVLYDSVLRYVDSMGQQEHIITTRSLVLFLTYLFAVCLNIYVLVPRFLLPKRYGRYILFFSFLILCLLLMGFSSGIFENENGFLSLKGNSVWLFTTQFLAMIFTYSICLAGSSMPVLFRHWVTSGKRMSELEKTKVHSELEYLKTQVHPHFLFNVLDKSVMLTPNAPEHASQILMKLSKLLRYQLYDSTREKVLLSGEIVSLKIFLELEKESRDDSGFSFSISTEGNVNQQLIPPLLFTPFVEYAINLIDKDEKESFINLSFHSETNQLYFNCICTKSKISNINNDLSDVKRRLELLFPHSHSLEMAEEKSIHSIKLYLNLWQQ